MRDLAISAPLTMRCPICRDPAARVVADRIHSGHTVASVARDLRLDYTHLTTHVRYCLPASDSVLAAIQVEDRFDRTLVTPQALWDRWNASLERSEGDAEILRSRNREDLAANVERHVRASIERMLEAFVEAQERRKFEERLAEIAERYAAPTGNQSAPGARRSVADLLAAMPEDADIIGDFDPLA